MELLTASLITVRHGFPSRAGGVSAGPYQSLNSSSAVGDDLAAVKINLQRLAEAAGVAPEKLLSVKQVHGDRVVEAAYATAETEADALWTDVPGTAVGVRTADCLPILIEDPRGRVAAVHAGWRGVISEIVARTIEQLVSQGAKVDELRVAIGPCIQRCCFEVDGALAERFGGRFGREVIVQAEGQPKPRLDLPRAVKQTLERVGVMPGHMATLPQCTMCEGRFFSHRREHGLTGRHLSFISCVPAPSL